MKNKIVTEEEKDKLFDKEYAELCVKYNRSLCIEPKWKRSKDNNDFTLVLAVSIVKTKNNTG